MTGEITPQERLARYAVEKSYFRPSDGTVRHNAFMPASDGKTSVFCVSGLADTEIRDMGTTHVAEPRDKPLLGWAEIVAKNVFDKELRIKREEPPPRHANIMGWPDGHSERKLIAMELAALSAFHPS